MFVDRAAGHVPLQLGVLGAVCVGIALIADSAWAIVSGTARLWLAGSPARRAGSSSSGSAFASR